MVRASVLASSVSWVRIPPEQLFFLFGEKRVVWVSCLPLFSIYRKEFSCADDKFSNLVEPICIVMLAFVYFLLSEYNLCCTFMNLYSIFCKIRYTVFICSIGLIYNCRVQRGFESGIYCHDVCTYVSVTLRNVAVTSHRNVA